LFNGDLRSAFCIPFFSLRGAWLRVCFHVLLEVRERVLLEKDPLKHSART